MRHAYVCRAAFLTFLIDILHVLAPTHAADTLAEPDFFLLQSEHEWRHAHQKLKTVPQNTPTHQAASEATSNTQAKPREQTDHDAPGLLCLQGILFQDEQTWSVWINGKAYHPAAATIQKGVSCKAINGHTVEITHGSTKTLLFLGQSYDINHEHIVHIDQRT